MAAAGSDNDSDYGWDQSLEEDVHQLLNTAAIPALEGAPSASVSNTPLQPVLPVSDIPVFDDPFRHEAFSQSLRAAAGLDAATVADPATLGLDIAYPDLSQVLADFGPDPADAEQPGSPSAGRNGEKATAAKSAEAAAAATAAAAASAANASPLVRFRTYPRKPLSVSDLTSGAWCELQYEYTLTRLPGGRRTRTTAMRAGTEVHARLEEAVHTTVRVDVASKEDLLGLKLWNMVQGLRTLRETGLTRELEIWGVVDTGGGEDGDGAGTDEEGRHQVVSGVIDALSYHNPDPAFEEQLRQQQQLGTTPSSSPSTSPKKKGRADSVQSTRITDFFGSSQQSPSPSQTQAAGQLPPPQPDQRKIYITDIKTRGSPRLPTGAAVRPTRIQLFLYHRFLSGLASGQLDFLRIFERYGLNADAPFSDAFMAQIGGLHDEIFDDEPLSLQTGPESSIDGSQDKDSSEPQPSLMRYSTLRSLLDLLQAEVALTFPEGANSVGGLVAVEYRLRPDMRRRARRQRQRQPSTQNMTAAAKEGEDAGECSDKAGAADEDDDMDTEGEDSVIGTNVMPVDPPLLDRYLRDYLAWWRGRRPAVGVTDLEEAGLKCGHCEFAAGCDWRAALDEARVQQARARVAGRGRRRSGGET